MYGPVKGNFVLSGHRARLVSPRFHEIIINHTPPGGSSSLGIMRGCQAAAWHECGHSAVRMGNFMHHQSEEPGRMT